MRKIKQIALSLTAAALMLTAAAPAAFAGDESAVPISAPVVISTDTGNGWFDEWAALYGYKDIFLGEDGSFHPEQSITRMEFMRMLHRALGININYFAPVDIADYFDDVTNSDAGASELHDLVTCGIVDFKGSFRPSEALDRDEMIHYIMNALYRSVGSGFAIIAMAPMPFDDDQEIRSEYRTDVERSVILGLINGVGGNLLNPRRGATRAEAVTVAGRLIALIERYDTQVAVDIEANKVENELHLRLSLLNNGDQAVRINHNSGQKFDFVARDKDGGELYRWSDGRMFTMALTSTVIGPGEEVFFSAVLDEETYAPIADDIASVTGSITGTSSDFNINPDGYTVYLSTAA